MSKDILSATDLTRADIEHLFKRADELARTPSPILRDKIIAFALFDASVPVLNKLEDPIRRAGAEIRTLARGPKISSVEDIIREVQITNAAAIVISHPESGAAASLAQHLQIPVVNAGDGTHENPLRALVDLYAITKAKGALEGIRVALLGNLKFGAEAHSLARLLGLFNLRLSFVSPAALSMPYDLSDEVRLTAYEVEETNDLATTLRKTDVLYLSRIDPARVEPKVYEKTKKLFDLSPTIFDEAKSGLFIFGEWDGADELLANSRQIFRDSTNALVPALIEFATN